MQGQNIFKQYWICGDIMDWLITDGINNGYPYLLEVPIPSETALTEPYPRWMWRIDEFYNDGYPYLIGLRPPYVIPDDKYLDGHGLAVVWDSLLNLLEEKADLAYVDNAVAETVLINSTTETATNQKWLDGKPIHRKLFEIPNASLTAGLTQIALDVLNVETITNLHATIERTASTSLINVNSYWCSDLIPTVSSQIIKIECVNGNLEILKQNDMSVDYKNLKITVEFTKTTD